MSRSIFFLILVSLSLCSGQQGGEGRGFEGKGRGEGGKECKEEGRKEDRGHEKEGKGEGRKEGRREGRKEGRRDGRKEEGRGREAEIKEKGGFVFHIHGNSDFGHGRSNERGFDKEEAFERKGKFEGRFKRRHGHVVIAPVVTVAPPVVIAPPAPCPPGVHRAVIPAGRAPVGVVDSTQIGQTAPTNIMVKSNTDGSVEGGNGAADEQVDGEVQGAPIVGQAHGTRLLAAINKHRINGRA